MPLSTPLRRRRRLLPLVLGCALGSVAVTNAASATEPAVSSAEHDFGYGASPFTIREDDSIDAFRSQLRSVERRSLQESQTASVSDSAAADESTASSSPATATGLDVPLPPRDVGRASVDLSDSAVTVPLPPRADELPIIVPRAAIASEGIVTPHVTATIDVLVCAPESADAVFPAATADGWRPRTPSQELTIAIAEQLPAGRARVEVVNSDATIAEFGEWTIAVFAEDSPLPTTTLRAGFETTVAAQLAAGEPLLAPALTDAPDTAQLPAADNLSTASPALGTIADTNDSRIRSLDEFLAPVVTITELEQMADASNVLAPVVLANPLAAGAFNEIVEPLPPAQQRQLDAATSDLFKPVTSIAIKPEAEAVQPPNLALHVMGTLTPEAIWSTGWSSPQLSRYPEPFYHRPLRFEQANLERCGISHGCATTITSAACFFGSCLALPASLIVQPPCRPVETLGDCRTCQEFGKCESWFR